mmetsp:Transcript_16073/g.45473  ORF Transcript_16073/g.45473 Transcript_16073/m.45473 type:complete len:327 (+) Transcript_16073:103-1083(+)|eukprot:CAMPEP_0119128044 /NCGR_PEP_ID=MMETSP1310-20130426/6353_1 /TAXON_ID=464262 /ORGANISM="Genus nov. species nov., Strain RCC2339" /LENGTH=326 /DNA_ID=CAMNT_0007118349 /DNA_START=97 /DNA_END=1077 /DNA_ORIENTATION=-
MASEMRAVQYTEFSDDVTKCVIVKVPVPQPEEGEVLVKVSRAAANPIDWKVMGGHLQGAGWKCPLPFTMGYDLAGTVEALGGGANFAVGDRVFAVQWGAGSHGDTRIGGTFADYVVVPASRLSRIPEGVSDEAAAASALVGTTAFQALDAAGVKSGSRVLILGGSSAVGLVAVQLAKLRGATVITTCSTRTIEFVKSLGADEIINYRETKWDEKLVEAKVDVVFDTVGEEAAFKRADAVVKEGGSFITIASFDAGFAPDGHQPRFGFASFFCLTNDAAVQDKLAAFIKNGKLKIPIEKSFAFDEVHEMLACQKGGKSIGKNVLVVH